MLSIIEITLAFVLGTIWGLYLEIHFLIIASIFLLFLMLILFIFKNKFKFLRKYFFSKGLILIFTVFMSCFYSDYKINTYNKKYVEGEINDTFTIISHVSETEYYYKYYAKNTKKNKFILYFKKSDSPPLEIGTKILLAGIFEYPAASRNNGGFNYKLYLNTLDVYGSIKVSSSKIININSNNIIYRLQNLIRNNLINIFPKDYAGILCGMLIGETTDISKNTKEIFKESGITHLLAVSGSNVSLVISISIFMFSKILGKKISDYCSIIFTVFFILLSGSSPSVTRAGIMGILNILANIVTRETSSINNIFVSAFIILLINPLSLFNVGFILSFTGTIGIVLFSNFFQEIILEKIKIKIIAETLGVTLSAQLTLIPIMAYYFNTVSIISIFTNLLIVPFASMLTVFSIIIFCISIISSPIAKAISFIIKLILKYILTIAEFFSKLKILNLTVVTPSITEILLYYLILYYLIATCKETRNVKNKSFMFKLREARKISNNKFRVIKYSIIVLLIALISNTAYSKLPKHYIEITAIDVGQGDSFLIQTHKKHNILIDGGGSETSSFDVGNNILVPYLLDKKISKIDLVIISHAHADHIDGIYSVIEELNVKQIVIGPYLENDEKIEKLKRLCAFKGINIKYVTAEDIIYFEKIKFEIIYPYKIDTNEKNINNLSLVIKVLYGRRSMLFTGDIEEKVENEIISNIKQNISNNSIKDTNLTTNINANLNIKSDILKVAHHGAKTSSTEEFIKEVSPQIAIISVAKKNTYGHPNNSILNRLKSFAQTYLTKDEGEITLRIYDEGDVFIKTYVTKMQKRLLLGF